MAPPWVTLDSVALHGGDCGSGADPDIAGLGVVLPAVLASVMTTITSIAAMIRDQKRDSAGQSTPEAPIRQFRERFFDTEWKKDYARRPFLDPWMRGLGDQQLITSYAVLISGWIKIGQDRHEVQGAHFVLVLCMCALSSSSQLATLIMLRKYFRKYKLIAKIRLSLMVILAFGTFSSMIAAICMPRTAIEHNDMTRERRSRSQRLYFLIPQILILVGFSAALFSILFEPRRKPTPSRIADPSEFPFARRVDTFPKQKIMTFNLKTPAHASFRVLQYLFMSPLIGFGVQIVLAMVCVVLVVTQKFSPPRNPALFCGLQNASENVWGFAQTLRTVLLISPAMGATQSWLERRQDLREDASKKEHH